MQDSAPPTGHQATPLEVVVHHPPKDLLDEEQLDDATTVQQLRNGLMIMIGAILLLIGASTLCLSSDTQMITPTSNGGQRQIHELADSGIHCATIGYVTDAEGDFEWFLNAVRGTGFISIPEFQFVPTFKLESRDSCFVYGGDTVDATNSAAKVGGDIRIVTSLNKFKDDYPDQVFFILGNRDSNKLRLIREVRNGGDPNEFKNSRTETFEKWQENLKELKQPCGPAEVCKLKYILGKTMGAPRAFEMRREELKLQSKATFEGGAAVVKSYLDSVEKGGFMFEYIQKSVMALKLGNTLFVHAIPKGLSLTDANAKKDALFAKYAGAPETWDYSPLTKNLDGGFYTEKIRNFVPTTEGHYYGNEAAFFEDRAELQKELIALMGDCTFMVVGHIPMGASPTVVDLGEGKWLVDGDVGVSGGNRVIDGEMGKVRSQLAIPSIVVDGGKLTIEGEFPNEINGRPKKYKVELPAENGIGAFVESKGLQVADGVFLRSNAMHPNYEQAYYNGDSNPLLATEDFAIIK